MALAGLLVLGAGRPADAQVPEDYMLGIYHDDELVGSILWRFAEEGASLVASSRILVERKQEKRVISRHREVRREVWRDGRLVEFRNDIERDGNRERIRATLIGDRLAVTTADGTAFAPKGCALATFWHRSVLHGRCLIEPDTGAVHTVDTMALPPVTLETPDGPIRAAQILVTGGTSRNVYYDASNRWQGMVYLDRSGRKVRYLPVASGPLPSLEW